MVFLRIGSVQESKFAIGKYRNRIGSIQELNFPPWKVTLIFNTKVTLIFRMSDGQQLARSRPPIQISRLSGNLLDTTYSPKPSVFNSTHRALSISRHRQSLDELSTLQSQPEIGSAVSRGDHRRRQKKPCAIVVRRSPLACLSRLPSERDIYNEIHCRDRR